MPLGGSVINGPKLSCLTWCIKYENIHYFDDLICLILQNHKVLKEINKGFFLSQKQLNI